MNTTKKVYQSMDGNTATAYSAYAFSELAAIYPITPSSPMAEAVDQWATERKKNFFNSIVKVIEMQSEAGAIASVHGALQGGTLATTFTASQGLLLMIPNIYKIQGELLPGVIHVAARSIATRALSIFGDHQDVYAVRQTGVPIICSHSVQECMDLAGVAHLSAIKAQTPFIHFFDGFRTSHEIQKIEVMDPEFLKGLIDVEKLEAFRKSALNPHGNAVTRGGAENDDVYFQGREAQNLHYANVVTVVEDYFKKISEHTGRHYAPFTYYGALDATRVIIAMGSVTEAITETVDALNATGEKVGLIKVHLFRPFSIEHLQSVVPNTVRSIAVLDRSKEMGAREPLYLDVVNALKHLPITIIGGRYGLSSKNTDPTHIHAVYEELKKDNPKVEFTIGITDDVTHLSLDPVPLECKVDYTSCLFYGLGSDGTVSANKNTIKIIGDNTPKYVQAYFAYDSKKAGGITRSHLRFGDSPIRSTYYIDQADFISCSLDSFCFKYDMLKDLKEGGTFLLSTTFKKEEIPTYMPNKLLAQLARKKAKFYIIDANGLAQSIGMGRRTNTILQSAFFALNPEILPYDKAVIYMKEMAKKTYSKNGEEIVALNYQAIDLGKGGLVEVEVLPEWVDLPTQSRRRSNDDYFHNHVRAINELEGYSLPVSHFMNHQLMDGTLRNNVTYEEKRVTATKVPKWKPENCIQCGICSFVCPHATIRTFLLTDEEIEKAPQSFETLQATGRGVEQLKYRVQVSPANCVGCTLCAVECPGKGGKKALEMVDVSEEIDNEPLATYLYKGVEYKSDYFPISSLKGSQFLMPYFEVSAACAGCGETTYYRLVSQLFGKDLLIANATGCSSIYCGSTPSSPFVTDENDEGVAWANSLFEDNAEFGFGMAIAQNYKMSRIYEIIEENMQSVEEPLQHLLSDYLASENDRVRQRQLKNDLLSEIQKSENQPIKELLKFKNDLVSKSCWIIGGDGWAYDIGYGGLDHVLANNMNVNILILDTEVYSNTGGQSSKSSQAASIAKFAAGGKAQAKKDLGQIAMAYGHVYVAQICMGADRNQTLKAIREAESYNGPSLIIAYSPCIEHGIKGGLGQHQKHQKLAVESGYLTLYRYDPRLEKKPLIIDSRAPKWEKFNEFLLNETRYSRLISIRGEEEAYEMFAKTQRDAKKRYQRLVNLSKEEIIEA